MSPHIEPWLFKKPVMLYALGNTIIKKDNGSRMINAYFVEPDAKMTQLSDLKSLLLPLGLLPILIPGYPIFSIPHPPPSFNHLPAHAPSYLTSPVPETPLKHPIYRSIFCLMRTAAKPASPCATTASSPFRCGFPGLEGLRRGYHLPAGDQPGAAGQHRAVPQRRAAHAGGPARHPHLSHQRRLHRGAHQPTHPPPALHHRPHRPPVPGGDGGMTRIPVHLTPGGAPFARRFVCCAP